MADWLTLLRIELENLDQGALVEPIAEMERNDHVVGEASLGLRKIYTLSNQFAENAARMSLEVQLARDNKTREEMFEKFCELDSKARLLREIFWTALKDEHQLWNRDSIGIRTGWQVTWSSDDRDRRPNNLWRKFLGG